MGLLRIFRYKAPARYEDIAGDEGTIPKGLRRLRLIWFLAGHPDEAERYNRDIEARMIRHFGKNLYAECLADPRKKARELRKEMRGLRKGIRKERDSIRKLRECRNELSETAGRAAGRSIKEAEVL